MRIVTVLIGFVFKFIGRTYCGRLLLKIRVVRALELIFRHGRAIQLENGSKQIFWLSYHVPRDMSVMAQDSVYRNLYVPNSYLILYGPRRGLYSGEPVGCGTENRIQVIADQQVLSGLKKVAEAWKASKINRR